VSWGAAETRGVSQGSQAAGRQAGRNRLCRFQEASHGRTIRQTASELFNRFGFIKFCLMRFYGDAPQSHNLGAE
jgi:hypothetical protein